MKSSHISAITASLLLKMHANYLSFTQARSNSTDSEGSSPPHPLSYACPQMKYYEQLMTPMDKYTYTVYKKLED